MKYIKLENSGLYTIVSDEDYEYLLTFKWRSCKRSKKFVAISSVSNTLMHRLIMDAPDGIEVDHINRNTLDNRRENLRLCNRQQNSANVECKNKLGYKGVEKIKENVYHVKLTYDRKTYHFGNYSTIEGAAAIYDIEAIKLFGEFACLNFTDDERKHITIIPVINCRKTNATSGYKGVTKHKNVWRAYYSFNSKSHHIGYYDSVVKAALAYDHFIVELKDCNEYLNFPEHEGRINPNKIEYKNPCGFKGISKKRVKSDGTIVYTIQAIVNGKKYHIGYTEDPEEGHKRYLKFIEDKLKEEKD